MSEFKTIETQEQLNEVLKERLESERNSVKKEYEEKYKDFDTYKSQVETFANEKKGLEDTIKDLQGKADSYATLEKEKKRLENDSLKVRIALKNGIPYDMAMRLTGDDEESIEKDAKNMAQFMHVSAPPLRNPEAKATEAGEEAYKNLVKGLKIEK